MADHRKAADAPGRGEGCVGWDGSPPVPTRHPLALQQALWTTQQVPPELNFITEADLSSAVRVTVLIPNTVVLGLCHTVCDARNHSFHIIHSFGKIADRLLDARHHSGLRSERLWGLFNTAFTHMD